MWSTAWKEQESDTNPAIAVFSDGTEMQLAGVLHGDVMEKHVRVRAPANSESEHVVHTCNHEFFGLMKVSSKVDKDKLRFACISSKERNFVCQISSQAVKTLEQGHQIMKAVANYMVDNPDKTEKKDIYKIRDEMADKRPDRPKPKAKGKKTDTGKDTSKVGGRKGG